MKDLPNKTENTRKETDKAQKDAVLVKEEPKFSIRVNGTVFDSRKAAGEALVAAARRASNGQEIGEYRGFKVKVLDNGDDGMQLVVANAGEYQTSRFTLATDPQKIAAAKANGIEAASPDGMAGRLDTAIEYIPRYLINKKDALNKLEADLKLYQGLSEKPFEHAEKLERMEKEYNRLSRKLQGEKVEDGPSDNYVEDDLPEDNEPSYHYGAKEPDPIPVETINPKAEIAAVKAEIEPVEKPDEIKLPPANIEKIIDKIAAPVEMAAGTSVQVGLSGMETKPAQVKMFEESNTAAGQGGAKPGLIDIEAMERAEQNKPLKGQTELKVETEIPLDKQPIIDKPQGYVLSLDIVKYIRSLKNPKKADYANRYAHWLINNKEGDRPDKKLLSAMGAQSVELALNKLHEPSVKPVFEPKIRPVKKVVKRVLTDKPKQAVVERKQVKRKAAKPKTEKPSLAKPATKATAKPTRKKVTVYKMRELKEIHANRSPRSKAIDEAQLHSDVITPKDTHKVKRWITTPGVADIRNIDTPKVRIYQDKELDIKERKRNKPIPSRERKRRIAAKGYIDLGGGVIKTKKKRKLKLY